MIEPDFTLGIEEEYLLVDADTGALAAAPEALIETCRNRREGQVSPEFLQCQVEVGTTICADISAARDDLRCLRRLIRDEAAHHGLLPMAAACHPWARWQDQRLRDRDRYAALESSLAGVARRMLICGMHVHIGIEDPDLRIDLMNQARYFLPHLLALSTSSPFWQGHDTGLASYRVSVFDNMPRTGLPPAFTSFSEFQRSVQTIVHAGLIEDSSMVWWDLRPSNAYPTLETRICDVSPRIEEALSIAALTQCLFRMLWRLRCNNQRWRVYDRFLIGENRWRAQRYGTTDGLIDLGRGRVIDYADLLDEIIALVQEDAEALHCLREVEAARAMVTTGTSAERQRAVHRHAMENGATHDEALRAVVTNLCEEFNEDL
ncbi:carboxylate-amine ligase [Oceaniglobus indicus]|uniref:carboxylate-amine ligase n=1 Tax=Oceaniglobus indicus TaxID=2047749 RepID=UPI000C18A4DA|nr:carboxylate-amine ligase [Oceaniglobus indicus]